MPTHKVQESDRSLTYEFGGGQRVNLPSRGEADAVDPSVIHFEAAADVLGDAIASLAGVEEDQTLSPLGKKQKRMPKESAAVEAIATRWAAVDAEETKLAAREAALLAIPTVDPQHSAVAIEDREIRDWFRGMSPEARLAMLQKIDNEPGHARVMLALMRSPVPGLDHEEQFVRDVWKRTKRLGNPAEATAIDAGRANVDWARRGLASAAGVALNVTKWNGQQVLRQLLKSTNEVTKKGYGAFGLNAFDAANAQRHIDARSINEQLAQLIS